MDLWLTTKEDSGWLFQELNPIVFCTSAYISLRTKKGRALELLN